MSGTFNALDPKNLMRLVRTRVFDALTRQPAANTVVARNTPIPARRTITYYTNRADQARIILDVVQTKGSSKAPVSLGHFAFPVDRPRKNHPLENTLGYDEHRMVNVVAREPDSGREVKRDFTGSAHPMDRIMASASAQESWPPTARRAATRSRQSRNKQHSAHLPPARHGIRIHAVG